MMFKRIYTKMAIMLIASVACLLVAVGFAVYYELRSQLVHTGMDTLKSETSEVQDFLQVRDTHDRVRKNPQDADHHSDGTAVSGKPLPKTPPEVLTLGDDRGQNVYYMAFMNGHLVMESSTIPVPSATLMQRAKTDGYYDIIYKGVPYRVLSQTDKVHGTRVILYAKTQLEAETLRKVINVMLEVGGAGLLVSILMNLWLARRAIRPARQTWSAYQDMMMALSHELQTPLATINVVASRPDVGEEARRALTREVNHASDMVRDILYLSRLRTSLPEHPPEPVAVSDLTEESAARFSELAQGRQITLVGSAVPGLFVSTTSEKWLRLVSTVFKNVIDHARSGTTATWTLTAHSRDVELTVVNDAANSATSELRETGGRGFGLKILRGLVEEMRGQVQMGMENGKVLVRIRVPRLHPDGR